MNRGDYDDADAQLERFEQRHGVQRPGRAEPPRDRFALADCELCELVASEHHAAAAAARRTNPRAGADDTAAGEQWADLAARIQSALAGAFARFTMADVTLVESEHLALLRATPAHVRDDLARAAAKVRSRSLSRLGVLLVLASRGKLEQLRGRV